MEIGLFPLGIVLALVSTVLAVGMSWGHLRAAWSGQTTVDQIDH